MKGFTKDGKFHPIKPYNKVRKSRDQKVKTEGVRFKKTSKTKQVSPLQPRIDWWNSMSNKERESISGLGFYGDVDYDKLDPTAKQLVNRAWVRKFAFGQKNWQRMKRSAKEQKLELLEPFFNNNNYVNGHRAKFTTGDRYGQFDHLTVDVAESLMTGEPNINPKDNQNNSPKAKELVELAKKHNGTLGGYYINSSDTTRDDARITLESIFLKMTKGEAEKLREKIFPDEFDKQKDGTWRFWWD